MKHTKKENSTHMAKLYPGVRELPSGKYNYRKNINGKTFSHTFDHIPLKRELDELDIKWHSQQNVVNGTFHDLCRTFMKDRENVFKDSTAAGYESIMRNLSPAFMSLRVRDLTREDVQRELNDYSATRAPKSVKNASGFISDVLKAFDINLPSRNKLPVGMTPKLYIPTDEEVKKVLDAVKGTEYEIATILGALGLRRSELLAITPDDIKGNILTINKALLKGKGKEFHVSTTKTDDSVRKIWLPDYVVDLINEKGCVYEGYPGNILRNLHRVQDSLGIPRFRLHDLRHYYVSMAHANGVPDASIAATVGHKNTNTTRKVYLHAQEDKQIEMQQKASNVLFST